MPRLGQTISAIQDLFLVRAARRNGTARSRPPNLVSSVSTIATAFSLLCFPSFVLIDPLRRLERMGIQYRSSCRLLGSIEAEGGYARKKMVPKDKNLIARHRGTAGIYLAATASSIHNGGFTLSLREEKVSKVDS